MVYVKHDLYIDSKKYNVFSSEFSDIKSLTKATSKGNHLDEQKDGRRHVPLTPAKYITAAKRTQKLVDTLAAKMFVHNPRMSNQTMEKLSSSKTVSAPRDVSVESMDYDSDPGAATPHGDTRKQANA